MWFNSIIMPLHLTIIPLNSIIMPRNIIIMLINIIFMPLHSIIVKTATRTHNNEYGQALMLTGFIHVTSHCFSLLGHWTRESTSRNLNQRINTPILLQGELRPGPGEGIYAAVQVDPPLASKTTGLDDKQLYFHVAHHTQVGVPRKNLSTEQGETPHWD